MAASTRDICVYGVRIQSIHHDPAACEFQGIHIGMCAISLPYKLWWLINFVHIGRGRKGQLRKKLRAVQTYEV